MEAIGPHDVASFDPRGLIGGIYVGTTKHYYILIIYSLVTCGPHGLGEDFYILKAIKNATGTSVIFL